MTPRNNQSVLAQGFAFKAYEIEELSDVYFFRRLGWIIACGGRALRMTPTHLTLVATLVGIVGGVLLYDERLGILAFAFLILYGVIDSADGQLARMTGQATEFGRVLDGVSGYVTHVAIYLAVAAGVIHRGGSSSILIWMLLAAIANAMQAQMYDYHRTDYATVVVEGHTPGHDAGEVTSAGLRGLYQFYLMTQRLLIGSHIKVDQVLATRSSAGVVRENDRARYREYFFWPVRGWNLLGDNTRRYAIGILVYLHQIDLFFAFVLLPMNVVFLVMWFWQRRADRRFLAGLVIDPPTS